MFKLTWLADSLEMLVFPPFSGWRVICLCLVLVILTFTSPSWAVSHPTEPTVLTLELLEERLHTPIISEGNLTVDLRDMLIDLRPENREFRDSFYQILRKELQKSGTKPLGLDMSNSLVEGDFLGADLGLRTPLYAPRMSGKKSINFYAPIFTPSEQKQLENLRLVCLDSSATALPNSNDCRAMLGSESQSSTDINVFRGSLRLVHTHFNGEVKFANTFFFQSVNAENAVFVQDANWAETRFSRFLDFSGANFQDKSNFSRSVFFEPADFQSVQFRGNSDFTNSFFDKNTKFNAASFQQLVKFNGCQWQDNVSFVGLRFKQGAQFSKADFHQYVFFTEAIFDQAVIFRESRFNQAVNLRGASIFNQADFSDALFAEGAFLNVPGLIFNSNQAKILGNPGEIGKIFRVPSSQGNQSVLRNLGQNFRQQQQIADANQLEYTKQRLRLIQLSHQLLDININTASIETLIELGFSSHQAAAIVSRRVLRPFDNSSDLLSLIEIDLDTYRQLSDRLVVSQPLTFSYWLILAGQWLSLSLLLLLSGYGTSFWLVLGVGGVVIAFFGWLFWLLDRFRRLRPIPIIPTYDEMLSMLAGFSLLTFLSLIAIFRNSEQPWLTIACLLIIILPVPAILSIRFYQLPRHHDLINVSYFSAEGTLRQLRLLIGRLPIIPRYQMFRERYLPLLWHRHWNWLNYYDFSLNNLLRLGFNDIRLRDEYLPGIISTLSWYQWSLGILYIILLLWTLSRTIPGLNLLIYLK